MADNRFPIFRLPLLALCKVLEFYGPQEIIQLSFCSKRSLRVAKLCWKKKGVIKTSLSAKKAPKVKLFFVNAAFYCRFFILEAKDIKDQQVHHIRIGDAVVPSTYKDDETLITYWDDKAFGMGQIIAYIKYLFDLPITSIKLKSDECPNEFIDCFMGRQESVRDCTLRGKDSIDECLTHLLDNCNITGNLWIYAEPNRKFRHNWNIHLDSIYISSGLCITLQNLTSIDCRSLNLCSSSLSSEDVNRFLKQWQNGGNLRIRYLSIEMKSINRDIVTSGIETVRQPGRLARTYPFMSNFTTTKCGGLDIRRNDGTIGSIFFCKNNFVFGV